MALHPPTLKNLLLCIVLDGLLDDVNAVATHEVDCLANIIPMRKSTVIGLHRKLTTLANVNT
jgi:hypothetical protein